MKIEWRKATNWRWPEDMDAFVGGKIRVGSLRRPIGGRFESPKVRAHTLLPQTSLENGKTFEASEIDLVKGLVENAIKSWFKVATTPDA